MSFKKDKIQWERKSCNTKRKSTSSNVQIENHIIICFLGWKDPKEEEMTTHSSITDWKIPWTEKPDRI